MQQRWKPSEAKQLTRCTEGHGPGEPCASRAFAAGPACTSRARPEPSSERTTEPCPKRMMRGFMVLTPNENKLSCGERKRAWLRVERFSSCENWAVRRLAVGCSDWLGVTSLLVEWCTRRLCHIECGALKVDLTVQR